LKFGATEAVATAVAPCAVTVSGRLVPVIVSGFELNATIAYSAPAVPPLKQIPVPVSPGRTLPAPGVVGVVFEHAVVMFDAPAVSAKKVTSDVPEMLAETETVPGDDPKVTWVFAWPVLSVVAVVGERVADPEVTLNVTAMPLRLLDVDETLTTRGVESV
jgi:hypothetical protein